MDHLKSFELFENENAPKPENYKDLKKLLRKISNDRNNTLGYGHWWGEFSTSNSSNHRGNFRFIDNDAFWNDKGQMSYTGSGNPKTYIDKINQQILHPIGWNMVDLGGRSVQIIKLEGGKGHDEGGTYETPSGRKESLYNS